MQEYIHGTFHFHSRYSHDGRSTLAEIASTLSGQEFSFCVMTEHFEDFDAPKLVRYIQEAREVSQRSGFVLIPGIEVHLSGVDTILFPVRDFAEIQRLASDGTEPQPQIFKVLAHPSKYPFELVLRHLERFKIDAVELWNQQVDSAHFPSIKFLEQMKTYHRRNELRYFFGNDIHNVNLGVANVISLHQVVQRDAESIAKTLVQGDFVCRNRPTGIEYRNGSAKTDLDSWIGTVMSNSYRRAKLRMSTRQSLRWLYKVLPRTAQHSLNDIKNYVRSKI